MLLGTETVPIRVARGVVSLYRFLNSTHFCQLCFNLLVLNIRCPYFSGFSYVDWRRSGDLLVPVLFVWPCSWPVVVGVWLKRSIITVWPLYHVPICVNRPPPPSCPSSPSFTCGCSEPISERKTPIWTAVVCRAVCVSYSWCEASCLRRSEGVVSVRMCVACCSACFLAPLNDNASQLCGQSS